MSKNKTAVPTFAGDQDIFLTFDRKKNGSVRTKDERHIVYSTEPYAQDMYNLLVNASTSFVAPKVGDVISGTVLSVSTERLVLDAGIKDYIYVDARGDENAFVTNARVGETVSVVVTEASEDPYHVAGSLAKMQVRAVRAELDALFASGQAVEGFINSMNPGGYHLTVSLASGNATLFMPHMMAGVNKLSNAVSLVNTSISVMLDSFSDDRGMYIASRKKYLETLIPAEREKLDVLNYESLLDGHQPAQYLGVVTGATSFGVFVEFNGCLTGMIHKANILPEFADRIAEITPGTEIAFYVKEIAKGGRIILTQVVRQSLWDTVRAKQTLVGKVRDVKHFGVLVKLDDETTGLVHTSEIAKAGKKLEDFKRDQEVAVRVLMVNKGERKIFLALNRD